jgi:hypothetical protein
MESWQPYSVTTRNVSVHSENKIHDDAEAQRYGFKGGLVPGTAVYSHMTRPVVARFGERWLERNSGDVVFFKPAYEGERLLVTAQDAPGRDHPAVTVGIANGQGDNLATLETAIPAELPAPDPLWRMEPDRSGGPRVPIAWDAVMVGKPMQALRWEPTAASQAEWCAGVSDDLPIYRGPHAPVHPGTVLQAANLAFRNHFELKPWIHVGSRILTRGALRVGQAIDVRAQPVERWEKKGHQFVKLYMAMIVGGELRAEVWHSAIFTVRPAA